MNRSEFMTKVGATMTNPQWAWTGVNHDTKQVFVAGWIGMKDPDNNKNYLVFSETWDESKLGYNDSLNNYNLVQNNGYKLCLFIAKQKDPIGRNLLGVRAFYFEADMISKGGYITAKPVKRIEL